ncbi:MAG: hypothetical protein IPF81_18895 [Bacteroidetes bacterium]|nr:hypothetical protein [Bacteroidota bacterium]MBP6402111.1 hypothetical protein [Bacteroidia bacterium]MBP6648767.1 hypothetical protein [Bacteroidia bacterium]
MKKSKMQVFVEFAALLSQIRNTKKGSTKATDKSAGKGRRIALIAILMLFTFQFSQAVTYYSRTSGGNWTTNATWSTVGYGNATNTGTYPKAGDVANIGNGFTIYINAVVTCATLNIGQGTSGILEFRSTGNFSLTVTGNITLNTGAKFWYNTATNRTHTVIVGGNFANFGVVDFYYAPSQIANVIFNGVGNSAVSGIGTWDLNTVTLNKSGSTAALLNVQSNNFELGIKTFVGTYGTYNHNNSGTYNINPTAGTFNIGPNMIYKVPQGTMWFASAAPDVLLQGSLYVNGGTVKIGTTAGVQGLRSDQNGTFVPYLEVSAGSLIVYGGITYGGGSSNEPFSFKMTGGTISLNTGTTGTNRNVFVVNDKVNSVFNMTAGTITIEKPNITGIATIDVSIPGTLGTVTTTGGTIVYGTAATANGAIFNFKPYPSATYPHFRITGSAVKTATLASSTGSTANMKLLSLYIDVNKTFDIRSVSGATGDTKTMTLVSTCNGVDAFYNNGTFTARQSTVTFNPTGAQAIGGTVTTTFYNLSINNSNHITLNRPEQVSNFLSMVNGKLLTTNTNVLTCLSAANANLGSVSSYVDGPMIHTIATASNTTKTYPIGKSGAYRAVVLTAQHLNASSVTYRAEVFNSAASGLPYTLPPSISNVSNVRYVQFTRQNVANFSSGKLQMYYDTDDGVADKNTLLVAHDNGTTQWQNFGGVATNNWTGNITSATFNNFHTFFALGNPPGGGNPLPIELATFSATLNGKQVDVKWTTQAEINNHFFTIERSSDNVNFSELGRVEGAGNSTSTNEYAYTDFHPLTGVSYYRLKQTDYDGKCAYFPVSVIRNVRKGTFLVYPNPSTSQVVHLNYGDDQLKYFTITVQDITGRIIPSKVVPEENGNMRLIIDEAYIRRGEMLLISGQDGHESIQQKLIIE